MKFIYDLLYHSKAAEIIRLLSQDFRIAILAYHRVAPLSQTNILLRDMVVDPQVFERQIKFISNNYNVYKLEELIASLVSNSKLIKNSIVITFDDAYEDNYEYVLPILDKYGLPATIFVSSGLIGKTNIFWWDDLARLLTYTNKKIIHFTINNINYSFNLVFSKQKVFNKVASILKGLSEDERIRILSFMQSYLEVNSKNNHSKCISWEQMKEMLKHNISFGCHSYSHCAVSSVSDNKLFNEVVKAKEILEFGLGQRISAFAYPYGELEDFDEKSVSLVANAGYSCGLTMLQGSVHCGDNVFTLKRIGVGGNDSEAVFKLKTMGLVPLLQ